MNFRLAVRSLATRPVRTAVLACGFGFGVAVMAELLGVGEVILEQAHSPALQGGGDLVISGTFASVQSARFLISSVLRSPDFAPRVVAASPSTRATLYLIHDRIVLPVSVRGGVPSLERSVGDPEIAAVAGWTDTPADARWSRPDPADILRGMDRFHPIPSASGRSFPSSWAEWLYFNGRSGDGGLRFYLTFMAGPQAETPGKRIAGVRLQLERGGRTTNYSAAAEIDETTLLDRAPDLDIGENRVRLEGLRYRIVLALKAERTRAQGRTDRPFTRSEGLTGEIVLDAAPRRSLPPVTVRGAGGWLSGYVVPVLSGTAGGALEIGGETVSFDNAAAYHDHNWGFWEGVTWQWGQVAHGDLSFVYGRVFPPSEIADPERIPGFLAVLGPDGPRGFSTDVSIEETSGSTGEREPGRGESEHSRAPGRSGTPRGVLVHARGAGLDVRMEFTVDRAVRTRMGITNSGGGSAMDFLQLGGAYLVTGRVAGRPVAFTAHGAAETFRPR
jgi:uncharacterized RDD family membrane protein YckC